MNLFDCEHSTDDEGICLLCHLDTNKEKEDSIPEKVEEECSRKGIMIAQKTQDSGN